MNKTSSTESFKQTMRYAGIEPPSEVSPDGLLHRFAVTGDKAGSKAGWYVFHADEPAAGSFGNWRGDISERWCSKSPQNMTTEERIAYTAKIEAMKRQHEAEHQRIQAECRAWCTDTWNMAMGATNDHPYLKRKSIQAYGIKNYKNKLLISVQAMDGTIHGLQFISPDGLKKFKTGTNKTGHFFRIAGNEDRIIIAEGYATAASIHEATGDTVIVAFDAGNLVSVAQVSRSKYPVVKIVIAADDDYSTEGNPGRTKAVEAAKAVGGYVAIPAFPGTRGLKDTDFNDLAKIAGLEAVKACIDCSVIHVEEPGEESSPGNQDNQLETEIQRLAALSPLEFDQVRKEKAKALGVRAGTLDAVVKAVRKEEVDDNLPFSAVEPWPEPVNPGILLTDVAATIRRFIICAQEVAFAAALWIALTWFIDVVQVAPLAIITAPEKRCGKTLLLNLMGRLSAKAVTASSISPPALYRTVELWHPTFFIDEADACLKDNEELRGILNSGHTRDSAYVIRCVGDNPTPTKFSTWGAKAISGIGRLADTLMDRAVVLELRRKLPHEKVERIRHAEPSMFEDLQSKLARFAEDYSDKVRQERPALPESLNDRAQDNWEPLLQIASIAGGEWLQIGTATALLLSGGETVTQTIGTELLADIQEAFESRKIERIFTDELIKALCTDDEKPWATFYKGKSITPRQLANQLKAYGIQSKTIRIGSDRAKGFEREQFKDAFRRYVSPEKNISPFSPFSMRDTGQSASILDLRDFSSVTDKTLSREEKQRNPVSVLDCHLVTDKKPPIRRKKFFPRTNCIRNKPRTRTR